MEGNGIMEGTNKTFGCLFFLLLLLLPLSAQAKERSAIRLELPGIAGGRALLEFDTAKLVSMTSIPFCLKLEKADGSPLAGASVQCDLTMPAMQMPENRPKVLEKGSGSYRGQAVFTMPGKWQAAFAVQLPEGGKEILLFDIERVLLK